MLTLRKRTRRKRKLQDEINVMTMDFKFMHVVPLLVVDFDVAEEEREENW